MSAVTGRRLEYSEEFEKDLEPSAKKDRGLRKRVDQVLTSLREQGPGGSDHKLKRVEGHSVFTTRIPAQGRGKSGGARLVYYCDHQCLLPILFYLKSEKKALDSDDIRKIKDALQSRGLWRA